MKRSKPLSARLAEKRHAKQLKRAIRQLPEMEECPSNDVIDFLIAWWLSTKPAEEGRLLSELHELTLFRLIRSEVPAEEVCERLENWLAENATYRDIYGKLLSVADGLK